MREGVYWAALRNMWRELVRYRLSLAHALSLSLLSLLFSLSLSISLLLSLSLSLYLSLARSRLPPIARSLAQYYFLPHTTVQVC